LFSNICSEKETAWKKIEQEFNALSTRYRPAANLKLKYENLKKTTKKKVTQHQKYVKGTGGGAAQPDTMSEMEHRVIALLGHRATGMESKFNGDANLNEGKIHCIYVEQLSYYFVCGW
jgi:hypothetical protein